MTADRRASGRQGAVAWEVSTTEGRAYIRLSGEIDLAAVEAPSGGLLEALVANIPEPVGIVECDLSEVRYMDSSGFHMLVKLQTAIEEANGRLVLMRPSDPVRQILEIAGGDLFRILD